MNGRAVFEHFEPARPNRESNCAEASINWNDAEPQALSQTLHDEVNAKYGAAEVSLEALKSVASIVPSDQFGFGFERKPLPKNPYHGNLLFEDLGNGGSYTTMKKAVCNGLALNSTIHPRTLHEPTTDAGLE